MCGVSLLKQQENNLPRKGEHIYYLSRTTR